MFKQGIKGVDFIVCNTDSQALQNSSVPNKIQLGVNLTEGLCRILMLDNSQLLVSLTSKNVDRNTNGFFTAGMGGGTGKGAVQ
jgi:cell division protein FtsZ